MLTVLRNAGWAIPTPAMALYLWMPLPEQASIRGLDDAAFATHLLNQSGVALTPGSGFGPGGSGWLRMALVRPVDELEQAAQRLAEALA